MKYVFFVFMEQEVTGGTELCCSVGELVTAFKNVRSVRIVAGAQVSPAALKKSFFRRFFNPL